ncbi:MAG: type II toxin-antitoxin system RelE/ParE family toxin [Lentisphaerae bacterium]|nr:type II toxin-antitoxin system RelE/ParE family toxin [Lentisphaerota bacterium]
MNLELIVRAEAEAEMAAAFDWYEGRLSGLGTQFLLAVDAALHGIVRNPLQFPLVHKTARRALLRRFPYEVLFVAEVQRVVVLAVFHVKRNPMRWQERI